MHTGSEVGGKEPDFLPAISCYGTHNFFWLCRRLYLCRNNLGSTAYYGRDSSPPPPTAVFARLSNLDTQKEKGLQQYLTLKLDVSFGWFNAVTSLINNVLLCAL